MPAIQVGTRAWPIWCDGLMNTAPGSIQRRFPTFWYDGEGGIDWNLPPNTDIVALADGQIVGAGYFCVSSGNLFMGSPYPCTDPGYGVVTTRVKNADGTQTDLYYQHIIIDPAIQLCNKGQRSCYGQMVHKGDIIGKANPGGWIEMGVNVGNVRGNPPYPNGWGGIWGADPSPGPHVDPEPYLRSLITNYGTSDTGGTSLTGSLSTSGAGPISSTLVDTQAMARAVHSAITTLPGFTGICIALDIAEMWQPFALKSSVNAATVGTETYNIFGWQSPIPDIGAQANDTITLSADAITSGLVFITTNTRAALIRGLLIVIGIVIIMSLIRNVFSFTNITGESGTL